MRSAFIAAAGVRARSGDFAGNTLAAIYLHTEDWGEQLAFLAAGKGVDAEAARLMLQTMSRHTLEADLDVELSALARIAAATTAIPVEGTDA